MTTSEEKALADMTGFELVEELRRARTELSVLHTADESIAARIDALTAKVKRLRAVAAVAVHEHRYSPEANCRTCFAIKSLQPGDLDCEAAT
jgi:hypothetical protein